MDIIEFSEVVKFINKLFLFGIMSTDMNNTRDSFKGIVHPKIIYSHLYHSQLTIISFIFETQIKIFFMKLIDWFITV